MIVARDGVAQWTDFFRRALNSAISDRVEPNGPLLFWTTVQAMRWIYPFQIAALLLLSGLDWPKGIHLCT